MPHKEQIAQYWCERGTIDDLDIDKPGCFACHFEAGSTWDNSRLDRARTWFHPGAEDRRPWRISYYYARGAIVRHP